ncbi:MAG TPA: alpha/beta hydrolase [Ktedonobacterales bacterium]|nr:alpha/beta hydrolase [Ktedonobacterales bacterium]
MAGDSLVFIHGSGDSASLWDATIAALPGVTTAALDLPGHGALIVEPGPERMSVGDYATLARMAMERLDLSGLCVVGHSLGAAIALRLAADAPALVRRLVIVGGGARLRVLPALLAETQTAPDVAAQRLVGLGFAPEHEAQAGAYLATRQPTAPGILHRDLVACDAFDITTELAKITQPTLVVVGAEDRLTPPKYATFLAERMPHAQAVVIPGAGHYVPIEAPDTLASVIHHWLAEPSR